MTDKERSAEISSLLKRIKEAGVGLPDVSHIDSPSEMIKVLKRILKNRK